MSHVIVKLWPGKSEAQKHMLGDAIVRETCRVLGYGETSVSVCFEEVAPDAWTEQVYAPDIQDKWDQLTRRPGYGPGLQAK